MRKPRRHAGRKPTNHTRGYHRLEQKFALLAWLHQQLGYTRTADLLADLKLTDEGYDATGRSYIYARLASHAGQWQGVTKDNLQRYDDNIRAHLAALNVGRAQPITLRYFQYLAALYTEIYLDRYCGNDAELLHSLNEFVKQHNANSASDRHYTDFSADDLGKLAFWMATGSGKTLLLHLNYRQFLHYHRRYQRKPLDNILLITPNAGLSQQHLAELRASNIPAEHFARSQNGWLEPADTVLVTEITKLVEAKTGAGASVPVEAFAGNNLVFVDEGHKGASSAAQRWLRVRRTLGATGFTFEYSATFGQALAAANNEALLAEYGKAIAFDYSYRHFYHDGYGKDFNILNLQQESTPEQTDLLLLANLLSFYEQQLVFAEQESALRPYHLAKPLWTFVGSSVNAVYRESGRPRSDVLTVVQFLNRVLHEPDWATAGIARLLKGQSDLLDQQRRDLFTSRFEYLRRQDREPTAVYRDALERVIHGAAGGLQLCSLRGHDRELGLKAAGSDRYFGVIYIGDTPAFMQLAQDAGLATTADALQDSLFDRINEPDSTIEILVGSRKFSEGWNSWRVSNMSLLHLGHTEGSQIIQLFGRGIRLRGRNRSLKRSSVLGDTMHPPHINLLETLNIFALRANYMAYFRECLENEGISMPEPLELPLFARLNQELLKPAPVTPRPDAGKTCHPRAPVLLQYNPAIRPVSVVISAQAQQIISGENGSVAIDASAGSPMNIPPASLDLVDWNQVYLALLEYKDIKGLYNLLIKHDALRNILQANPAAYHLVTEKSVVAPQNHHDRQRLQEAVTSILRSYADALYWRPTAQSVGTEPPDLTAAC